MIENILIYTIALLTLCLFFSAIYLEGFLIRKLYREICIEKKQQRISIWHGVSKRLSCLKSFEMTEPYVRRVKRAMLLHRIDLGLVIVLIVAVLVYKILGYGSVDVGEHYIAESENLTITTIEKNKTTIKHYDSLDTFFKDKKTTSPRRDCKGTCD